MVHCGYIDCRRVLDRTKCTRVADVSIGGGKEDYFSYFCKPLPVADEEDNAESKSCYYNHRILVSMLKAKNKELSTGSCDWYDLSDFEKLVFSRYTKTKGHNLSKILIDLNVNQPYTH
jgi:hypothetical protein